ncbi:MAG: DinB family protein [Alphaproteobacteria bacterium]
MLEVLRLLTRYRAWADGMTFESLGELPPDEVAKPRDTLFKSMIHTMNHNLVIDQIFKGHLTDTDHGHTKRNTPAPPPLADLAAAQAEMNDWFVAYAEGLDATAAAERIRFDFVDGGEGEMSRADMVLHVVNHASYHRGFVAEMMYQVPAKPPATDLPVYLRDAAPG